jgi:signal transduction histidine kinase
MYCASVRMRELLEELLDRSRRAEKAVELCSVGELVAGAVDKIAVSAEFQSVRIVQAIPESLLVPLQIWLPRAASRYQAGKPRWTKARAWAALRPALSARSAAAS